MKSLAYLFIKEKKKLETYNIAKKPLQIEVGSYSIKPTDKGKFKVEKGEATEEVVNIKGEYFIVGKLENGKSFLTPTKPHFFFQVKLNKKGKPDVGDVARGIKAFLKTTLEDGIWAVFEDLTIEKLK